MTFPFRSILKLAGDLLRRSWLLLMLVTLISLLPVWVHQYGQEFIMHAAWRDLFFSPRGFGPIAWALIGLSWFSRGFHMSAVTEIALRTAASKPVKLRQLLIKATVNTLPVLGFQLLLELITIVGGIFLVVPGAFLGAAFSILVPVYVCEGKSIPEAFRRSFNLTRHRRFPIACVWFAIFLIYSLATGSFISDVSMMEAAIHRLFPTLQLPPMPEPFLPAFSSPAGQLFYTLVNQGLHVALMVLNVSIYLGLRFQKNEPADNHIAALFE